MGRKLVRGGSWSRTDFYLGTQLCLATLSSALLFVIEILRDPKAKELQDQAVTALLFVIVVFAIYIWLLTNAPRLGTP